MWTLWEEASNSQSAEVDQPKHNFFESADDAEEDRTAEETLECDYQRDCIPLYKRIEEEQFGACLDFLNTGYWPGTFFQDPNPPLDQARTWVTRFEYKESKRVRWSQLPLHVAIVVEAPLVLIKRLVELYPQATRCTDDQRMLPLHLALRHGGDEEIVSFLLRKFPEAVNVRGGKGAGRLPVEHAIRGPNKTLGDILETFVEKSNAKTTKVAAKNHAKDLEFFQAKLQAKEYELANVKEKLASLDEEKIVLENELSSKRQELKQSMQNMEMLSEMKLNEIEGTAVVEEEVQKRMTELEVKSSDIKETESEHGSLLKQIHDLETQKLALNRSQTKAKQEEMGLLEELESVLDESIQELQKRSQEEKPEENDKDDDEREVEEESREEKETATRLNTVAEHARGENGNNGSVKDQSEARDAPIIEGTQPAAPETQDEEISTTNNSIKNQTSATESQKEIITLRSEVDRLRLELEKKSIQQKDAMQKKPVRSKPNFFKRKKRSSLVYAPTI